MNPQINQSLFSAHSSFGFYLTLTIQYSGTTTCLQPKRCTFMLVSVKRDLKCVF